METKGEGGDLKGSGNIVTWTHPSKHPFPLCPLTGAWPESMFLVGKWTHRAGGALQRIPGQPAPPHIPFSGASEPLGDHPPTLAPVLSMSPAASGNASSLKEKICLFVVVFSHGILVPWDQTKAPCSGSAVLTTGPPGKFLIVDF